MYACGAVCVCVECLFKSGINAEAVQKMQKKNTSKRNPMNFFSSSFFLAVFLLFFANETRSASKLAHI